MGQSRDDDFTNRKRVIVGDCLLTSACPPNSLRGSSVSIEKEIELEEEGMVQDDSRFGRQDCSGGRLWVNNSNKFNKINAIKTFVRLLS